MRAAGGAALASAAAGVVGPLEPPEPASAAIAGGGPAQLLIEDGSPHWLSPDIWVVPGTDPNGPAGVPVAGGTAYVYARVANVGGADATDAKISFYWGDPSAQLFYSTMHPIGTAFSTIPAGDQREVLCLTPWAVTLVNNGHECLIVTAQLPGDAPLPDQVDVMRCQNVAQRNLTVVTKLPPAGAPAGQRIVVEAPAGGPVQALLITSVGGTVPAATLASLGLRQRVAAPAGAVLAGLTPNPPGGGVGAPDLVVNVAAGQRRVVYVALAAARALGPDEYQLVTVSQRQGGKVVGGVSFVVANGGTS